jgi:hypothetical protein
MRSPRRFRPFVDCLQARIAPSAVAPVAPAARGPVQVVTPRDETGSPGSEGTGYGSYQIIMTPPGGGPPSSSTLC